MAQQTSEVDPNPFEDVELDEVDILGRQVFEGVLFTTETAELPTDIRTDDSPTVTQELVEKAKEFAAETNVNSLTGKRGTPQVAKPLPVEAQVETQSAPFVACAFYHMDLTSHDLHFAYNRAYRSDQYHVAYRADYETGDLTIKVVRSD